MSTCELFRTSRLKAEICALGVIGIGLAIYLGLKTDSLKALMYLGGFSLFVMAQLLSIIGFVEETYKISKSKMILTIASFCIGSVGIGILWPKVLLITPNITSNDVMYYPWWFLAVLAIGMSIVGFVEETYLRK